MALVEPATIAELLVPYTNLSREQLGQISVYIDILLKWNSKMNLTAVREPEEMVTRHFGESFFVASRLIEPDWTGSAIDVGSGAGFPGLPLAMYVPGAHITLVESQGKKATFLNEVIFALGLKNVTIFRGRAESFSKLGELVTMRAVERFEEILPIAAGLVAPSGRLALMVGSAQLPTATHTMNTLAWEPPMPIPGGTSRVLLVGTKSAASSVGKHTIGARGTSIAKNHNRY